ncbi:putative rhamnosyl transferase, partial [Saccharothrix sp. MB29]|nr:putative rhamnosyl transferase [Saccharothrix sp. MB29]
MDHVVLTRFNLPSVGAESVVRAQEGWLTKRVGLFERYCLPSVAAQTSSDFRWLIYFDPESPQWLKDRIAA